MANLKLVIDGTYLSNFGRPIRIVKIDAQRRDLPRWLRPFAETHYIDQDGTRYRHCGKRSLCRARYGDLVAEISETEYRAERYGIRVARIYDALPTTPKEAS